MPPQQKKKNLDVQTGQEVLRLLFVSRTQVFSTVKRPFKLEGSFHVSFPRCLLTALEILLHSDFITGFFQHNLHQVSVPA